MEHEDLLDASQDILALSTPVESPMTFSKRIIDRISTSSRRVTETVPNTHKALGMSENDYQFGMSKVFFRAGKV